ncbi:NAD(P)-dependent alcohol dehydrogenase [Streptomyces sp. BI20]|uniref:NAD(P)-dependent alcohol dehydrogenase n=1 Tax=Streptomyces sp. BI20 TaxID=3403460 RepID=UPI003C7689D8
MWAVLFDRYGGPEVLRPARVPRPVPRAGEVLVRVAAFSVNGGELAFRAGRLRPFSGRSFPKRIGLDLTGTVVGFGPGAASGAGGLVVGDRVWGVLGRTSGFGSAAEYVRIRPERLGRVPDGTDLVTAAVLPVATTAVTALRDKVRLRPGERVLVRGAAGGVGNAVVQLAVAAGAEVTGLARAENLDFVRALGAARAVDHRGVDARALGRFDVVVDTVGSRLSEYRALLAPGGRMVTIAFDLGRPVRSLGYIGMSAVLHGRGRVRFFSGDPRRESLDEVARHVTAGRLRPMVDTVFPLDRTAQAHRALEAGGVRGKFVVAVPAG